MASESGKSSGAADQAKKQSFPLQGQGQSSEQKQNQPEPLPAEEKPTAEGSERDEEVREVAEDRAAKEAHPTGETALGMERERQYDEESRQDANVLLGRSPRSPRINEPTGPEHRRDIERAMAEEELTVDEQVAAAREQYESGEDAAPHLLQYPPLGVPTPAEDRGPSAGGKAGAAPKAEDAEEVGQKRREAMNHARETRSGKQGREKSPTTTARVTPATQEYLDRDRNKEHERQKNETPAESPPQSTRPIESNLAERQVNSL